MTIRWATAGDYNEREELDGGAPLRFREITVETHNTILIRQMNTIKTTAEMHYKTLDTHNNSDPPDEYPKNYG